MKNHSFRNGIVAATGLLLLLGALFGCTPGEKPLVAMSASILNGKAPLDVAFDLSHSHIPAGTTVNYTLDFGDKTKPATGTSLDIIVHHTYETAGTFIAKLTVTDSDGHQGEAQLTITVTSSLPPVGTDVGMTAPDFTAHTIAGTTMTLSHYRGNVVLLEFWGAWCTPCKKSMPHLQNLYTRYHNRGLVVIAVSTDQTEQAAADFITGNGYTDFINVWEPGGKSGSPITKLYGVSSPFVGVPRTYVIDRQGIIRYVGHPDNLTDQLITGLL